MSKSKMSIGTPYGCGSSAFLKEDCFPPDSRGGWSYNGGADIGDVDNARNVALDRGTGQEEVDLVVVVACE